MDFECSRISSIVFRSGKATPYLITYLFRMKWLSFKGCSLVFVAFEFKLMGCTWLSFDLVIPWDRNLY